MPFTDVSIRNLRIYENVGFDAHEQINLILGGNACGKTSILEALHLVSTGKSFRSPDIENACRHGSTGLEIKANKQDQGQTYSISIEIRGKKRRYQLEGNKQARLSDIASRSPILLVSPDNHLQFRSKTSERRSVLDWVLFHVKPSFHEIWTKYQRLLTQRNACLRDGKKQRDIQTWNHQLVEVGESLTELRRWATDLLQPVFLDTCRFFVPEIENIHLSFHKGWSPEESLINSLQIYWDRDRNTGITHSGPHRADLDITVNNMSAKQVCSQGQSKLLFIALRLAQSRLLQQHADKECCILLDDLTAELDMRNQAKVLEEISGQGNQSFITATYIEQNLVEMIPRKRVFHVEQGTLKEQNSVIKQ